jgi:alanyl-tRNA synthetase
MVERLYYADSFLTTFDAKVTDIREVSRAAGQTLWKLSLDRNAFYPTSGGQPCDTGMLYATSRSGATLEVPIESVEEDEHGEVWLYTSKPLAAGTTVRSVVDWDRRFDHMQQHSAQHLLSAVFSRELNAHTVSFHLGSGSSTIDLTSDSVAHSSIERIERLANTLIAEDRAISVRLVSRAEAEAFLAAGRLRKLPEREGPIRLIEIADYDLNACGGTHLRSTGQIGGLLLRSTERVRQGLRVEFVAGLRAVATARHDAGLLTRAATTLSIGRSDVPEAIERLMAEVKANGKERQKLRHDLAEYHATQLVVEEMIEDHLRVIRRTYPDRDSDYVKILASQVVATAPQTVAILAAIQQDTAFVVMTRSRDVDVSCGSLLRDALAEMGIRGGGSADMAQGQVPKAALDGLMTALEAGARTAQQKSQPVR